ncbi:MAG: FxsA family protein [Ruminiclostridium sp.]|nr:FxsA family protein [Ruminiclostridium sp.]
MEWWNSLTDLQRVLASIAAPATLFMVLQFILMLFGFIHVGDADTADGADHGDLNVHDGMDAHDIADGHAHDIFSGGGHDIADGHVHEIFSGDGHDIADGHVHEIFSGDGHDIADGHVHDIFSGDGHDMADGHPESFDQDTAHGIEHDHAHSHAQGHHDDHSHDKGDALRLFTVRGIVAFLSVGGWMGVVAVDWNLPGILAVILAFAVGWLALWFVAWIIRAFVRMQQSGNVKMENAVGKDGDVYLTIPVNGRGKVNVIVQDRLCEMDAVSKADRAIKTGEKITVLAVASEGVLLVIPRESAEQKETAEQKESSEQKELTAYKSTEQKEASEQNTPPEPEKLPG